MIKNRSSLHVLMVSCRYFPYIGGVETHLRELTRRLVQQGIAVTLLTTMPHISHKSHVPAEKFPREEIVDGVRILRVKAWPPQRDYYIAPEIYSIIRRGHWDIVHCQGYHTCVPPITMFAARQAAIPYVLSFHSGGDSSRLRTMLRGAQRSALRPLLAGAERLIGPSRWEVEFFQSRLHLHATKFAVIPNGSSARCFQDGQEQTDEQHPLLLSIGRLERYKGHQHVIAAMPYVLQHVSGAQLRIVGVGPYEGTLRAMVRRLGLDEHVEIEGVPPGDDRTIPALITRSRLVTQLSEHEAQGLVVLEALAQGRPVLVAATSALQEFAEQGLARSVSLRKGTHVIAQAIVEQLHNPLLPTGVELPTWDDCAAAHVKLYESIVRSPVCAF